MVGEVEGLVGEEFFGGVFVGVGLGRGRFGHGEAVGVVVGGLVEDCRASVAAHHGADVALPVAHVDVRAKRVAVAGGGVYTRQLLIGVFVVTVFVVVVDNR